MQASKERRRKYFVDRPVQFAILRRAALYWLLAASLYTSIVAVFRILPNCFVSEPLSLGIVWYHLSPMVISSAVLFPVMMVGAVRFGNRFVGPMLRFRQVLRQLARGEAPKPVVLRRGDFWSDAAQELNAVSARIRAMSAKESNAATESNAARIEKESATEQNVAAV